MRLSVHILYTVMELGVMCNFTSSSVEARFLYFWSLVGNRLTFQLIRSKEGSQAVLQSDNWTPKPAGDTGHEPATRHKGQDGIKQPFLTNQGQLIVFIWKSKLEFSKGFLPMNLQWRWGFLSFHSVTPSFLLLGHTEPTWKINSVIA